MSRTILVLYAALGLSVALAKKGPKAYEINLAEPALVGSVQLPPGDYKVRVEGAEAVFHNENSRQTVEAPVVVHNDAQTKYDETAVTLSKDNSGGERIMEITLQGTRTELDFTK